ncbi:MAG: transaldolase [Gemmatimonadaceae bacterium]|jgi:transaldolase|nr:transaldolase [Gemmatimonadaceae bacterium]
MRNRLHELHAAGQSIWLDYIDRAMLHDGTLAARIRDDALMGMTSNPTIFEKALAEGTSYDDQLAGAATEATTAQRFELVATTDVRDACDAFRGVYDRTDGGDGYVSLEVAPTLANDASGTVEEAHRLWRTVDRPNCMIKVPGTVAGAEAIRQLIADGLNVNVTLLFSLEAHRRVIDAYLDGIAARVARGLDVSRVASVASFFISRVDSEIDKRLDAMATAHPGRAETLAALKGQAAIANARLAYRLTQASFSGERWAPLAARGAHIQRPLWASTSTKNPAYRDVRYVEELIGPGTVNTLPPATLEAFRDHGETRRSVDEGVDRAERTLAALEAEGISLREVTDLLLDQGLAAFEASYSTLLAGIDRKSRALATSA